MSNFIFVFSWFQFLGKSAFFKLNLKLSTEKNKTKKPNFENVVIKLNYRFLKTAFFSKTFFFEKFIKTEKRIFSTKYVLYLDPN